jgi:ribosomal protein S18 acetylase RimI-like enzyme
VEFQVRDARITDVERITAMHEAGGSPRADDRTPLASGDLLRQLVYLPQAVVLVADARRRIVGAVVLALRPSVSEGGFIATVDMLEVDPEYELAGVRDSLVSEALRSARNKGCVLVEAIPADPAEQARWQSYGFQQAGLRLERSLSMTGARA